MPGEFPVSVDGWFRSGWHTFKTRNRQLIGGVAIIILYSIGLMLLGYLPGGDIIGIIIQLSFGLVLTAGWLNFCLRLVRDEEVTWRVMFEPFSDFQRVWTINFALSVIIAAGTLLFIIPGIYAILRLGLSVFLAVDRREGVRDTFVMSLQMTKGNEGKLLVYYGMLIGLYGLAVYPYFAGYAMLGAVTTSIFNFVLTPVLGVTYASAYDSLLYMYESPGRPMK